MRLWPRSMVGQTMLVLLAGVALSHFLALAIYASERRDLLAGARAEAIARDVVGATQALEATPRPARRRLAASLRRPGLRLGWGDQPLIARDDDAWPADRLRRALLVELGGDGGERVRVAVRPSRAPATDPQPPGEPGWGGWPDGPPWGGPPDGAMGGSRSGPTARPFPADAPIVLGALRLADGSFLNFAARFPAGPPLWATPWLAITLATTAVVLVVTLWAVRRAVSPLRRFAHAAERLGTDIKAPALADVGPTEVRQLARSFNRMQDRLQRLIADRTLMLAAISHDLRTPITRLRLRAELIDDDDARRKTLADLDEMQAMLHESMALARDEATGEAGQRLDLAALVQTVCAEWEDAGADVRYEGPAHLGFAGRPLALKRALSNLIGNAVRYGGSARATLTPVADGVRITVDDDGPGIPEGELKAVFRPFYRLDGSRSRQTGGAGLGLALVRSVVVAHGGVVDLANREGGGLRASIVLPRDGSTGFPLSTAPRNSNGQSTP